MHSTWPVACILVLAFIVPSTGFYGIQQAPALFQSGSRSHRGSGSCSPTRTHYPVCPISLDRSPNGMHTLSMAQHHAVLSKDAKLGMGLQDANDPQEQAKREFELNRGHAVDTLLADYPTIFSRPIDFSIFHEKIKLQDSQGFHVDGLRSYKAFFRIVPTLFNVCFSRCETSAVLMDKYGLDKVELSLSSAPSPSLSLPHSCGAEGDTCVSICVFAGEDQDPVAHRSFPALFRALVLGDLRLR
eukprot:1597928-Rhodomonas_salina.1